MAKEAARCGAVAADSGVAPAARRDWVQGEARSEWGLAGQGDRLDAAGHRGAGPFGVSFAGGFRDLYAKNIDWRARDADVLAAFEAFGAVAALRHARYRDLAWELGDLSGLMVLPSKRHLVPTDRQSVGTM